MIKEVYILLLYCGNILWSVHVHSSVNISTIADGLIRASTSQRHCHWQTNASVALEYISKELLCGIFVVRIQEVNVLLAFSADGSWSPSAGACYSSKEVSIWGITAKHLIQKHLTLSHFHPKWNSLGRRCWQQYAGTFSPDHVCPLAPARVP